MNSYLNYFFKKTKLGRDLIKKRFDKMIASKKEFKKEAVASDEGQEMIREKLLEYSGKMTELNNKLNDIKFNSASCSDAEDWFYEWWIEDLVDDIKKLKSTMYRFKLMLKHDDMDQINLNKEWDLEAIKKEVLIIEIMDRSPEQKNDTYDLYRCPIHNERTPSFRVYKDQNSWYCYGACQKGGSVIDLYMEINDCDFVTACKALSQ